MRIKFPFLGGALEGQIVGLLLTYCENLIRLVYGVIVLLVARQILSPEEFSDFAFYLSIAVMLYGFSKFSLDAFSIREILLQPIIAGGLVWRLVGFRFAGSIFFFCCIVLFLYLFDKIYGVFLWLIFFQAIRSVDSVEWFMRAEGKIALQALARIFSMLVVLLLLYVCISDYGVDVKGWHLVIIQSTEWFLLALIFFLWMRGRKSQSIARRENDSFKSVVSKSLPAYLAYVFFILYSKIDQLFLESILEDVAYGNYMVAARINESAVILIGSLNMVLFPKLLVAYNRSKDAFSSYVRSISLFFLFLSVIVISIVWGGRLGYDFLPQAAKNFIPYEILEYLSLMVFSTVPIFFFGLRSSYFTITDNAFEILRGGGVGLFVALVLGIPSMYLWGAYGGVLCFVMSCLGALFVSNFLSSSGRSFMALVFLYKKAC